MNEEIKKKLERLIDLKNNGATIQDRKAGEIAIAHIESHIEILIEEIGKLQTQNQCSCGGYYKMTCENNRCFYECDACKREL